RGELKVTAEVGEDPTAFAEIYQPLTLGQTWFVAASVVRTRDTNLLPVEDPVFAKYRTDFAAMEVDLGLQLGRFGELRFGVTRGVGRSRLQGEAPPERSDELPSVVDFDRGGLHFVGVLDQFDNMNFPRHGFFTFVDYFGSREDLGGELDYDRVLGFLGGAVTHGRHTALGLVNVFSALGSDSTETFSLGRLFAGSGYRPDEITGRYGGSAALLYLLRLSNLPPTLGDGIYAGLSIEAANLWQESSQVDLGDLKYSASISLGLDTLFGPIYLAQAFNEDGRGITYLFIGRTF
ncbi:MAG: hypothetical protein KDD47_21180, partial [Acidobacteria bacterium]|nr:hypothetical protein [Acidobacteriota bacterium]